MSELVLVAGIPALLLAIDLGIARPWIRKHVAAPAPTHARASGVHARDLDYRGRHRDSRRPRASKHRRGALEAPVASGARP